MVRFSDIIKTDNKSIRKMPATDGVQPVEEPGKTDDKAVAVADKHVSIDLLPDDTGSENVRTHYRHLFEKAVDIRDRVIKNLEISPSPFLHLIVFHFPPLLPFL